MEQIKFPLIHPSSDLNEIKDVDFMKTPRCMELLLEGKISKRNPQLIFFMFSDPISNDPNDATAKTNDPNTCSFNF